MNAIPPLLPDIAAHLRSDFHTTLDWVGMEHIALPIRFGSGSWPAFIDAGVDLSDPDAKGIHMSRIYLALNALSAQPLTVPLLRALLDTMLMSHVGLSATASLKIRFNYLLRRGALLSVSVWLAALPHNDRGIDRRCAPAHSSRRGGCLKRRVHLSVLRCASRQLNVDAFARTFPDGSSPGKEAD